VSHPGQPHEGRQRTYRSLCDRAMALVERAAELRSGDLLFPGSGGKKPMSDATMAKALREAGVPRERGTVHGLRSTFRDRTAEETSVANAVVEMAPARPSSVRT
jgi:integrase